MNILGISGYYHDSAAALIRDGAIVAAAQEERFSRKKGDEDFPALAAQYCLDEAGVGLDDIELVAFYDKPLAHLRPAARNPPGICAPWVSVLRQIDPGVGTAKAFAARRAD